MWRNWSSINLGRIDFTSAKLFCGVWKDRITTFLCMKEKEKLEENSMKHVATAVHLPIRRLFEPAECRRYSRLLAGLQSFVSITLTWCTNEDCMPWIIEYKVYNTISCLLILKMQNARASRLGWLELFWITSSNALSRRIIENQPVVPDTLGRS